MRRATTHYPTFFSTVLTLLAMLFLIATGNRPAYAADFACKLEALKSAKGVIGKKHEYVISGQCGEGWKSSVSSTIFSTTVKKTGYGFTVLGKASWDRTTGQTREQFQMSGKVNGVRTVTATCSLDPFLKDSPEGKGACKSINASINITSGKTWASLSNNEFWLLNGISVVAAQALSKEAAASGGAVPPPPAPKSKPKQPPKKLSTQGDSGVKAGAPLPTKPPVVKSAGQDKGGAVKFGAKVPILQKPQARTPPPAGQPTGIKPSAFGTQTAGVKNLPTPSTGAVDLYLEHVNAQAAPGCNAKQAIKVDIRVSNKGKAASPALSGNDALYITASDGFVDMRTTLPAMKPTQHSDRQLFIATKLKPAELGGKTAYLEVRVNKTKKVSEADHANNIRKLQVTFPPNHCKMTILPIQATPPAERSLAAPAARTPPASRTPTAPATR